MPSYPPDQLVHEARRQWLADEYESALDSFREAVRLAPDDPRLAVEAASYLGMRMEIAEAESLLRDCQARLADNADGLYQVGLAYERAFRPQDALRCYRHAIRLAPGHIGSWLEVAAWLERRHQLDEAWAAIEHCAVAADASGRVRFWRGKLLRRLGNHAAAEAELTALTRMSSVPDSTRIGAWYELAELFDRQGDADHAFQAATQAKLLQRPDVQPHLKQARALARLEVNFVDTISREQFQRWSTEPSHTPVALLTGPPRSGTTLVAHRLARHDCVTVADEYNVYPTYVQKELLSGLRGTAAGQALDGLDAERVGRAREKYFQWMSAAVGVDVRQCLLLDKNPSITFLIPPFRRLFPHATILMALRDPRDVVISCYLRHLPLNPVSAMFNQLDLTVMRCRAEWSAWLKLRQKLTAPWSEIRYEHVVEDADGAIGRICADLGVDKHTGSTPDDSMRHKAAAPDLAVRSPAYEQVAQPVHSRSVGRWRPYEKYLGRYLSELRPVLDSLDYA